MYDLRALLWRDLQRISPVSNLNFMKACVCTRRFAFHRPRLGSVARTGVAFLQGRHIRSAQAPQIATHFWIEENTEYGMLCLLVILLLALADNAMETEKPGRFEFFDRRPPNSFQEMQKMLPTITMASKH